MIPARVAAGGSTRSAAAGRGAVGNYLKTGGYVPHRAITEPVDLLTAESKRVMVKATGSPFSESAESQEEDG